MHLLFVTQNCSLLALLGMLMECRISLLHLGLDIIIPKKIMIPNLGLFMDLASAVKNPVSNVIRAAFCQ